MQTKEKYPVSATVRNITQDIGVIAVLLLLVIFGIFISQSDPAFAATNTQHTAQMPSASCSPALANHCYAQTAWNGPTPGAFTELSPYGYLDCTGCVERSFITNEMWFSDSTGNVWVESGIATYTPNALGNCHPGYTSTCLFWDDQRPDGSYNSHGVYTFGGYRASLDPYAIDITIENANDNTNTSTTWNLTISLYSSGNLIQLITRQSVSSSAWTARRITIGSELSSPNGYTSSQTYYNYNSWKGGVWNYQTNSGDNLHSGPPPSQYWNVTPCSCSGNTGGSFVTYDH